PRAVHRVHLPPRCSRIWLRWNRSVSASTTCSRRLIPYFPAIGTTAFPVTRRLRRWAAWNRASLRTWSRSTLFSHQMQRWLASMLHTHTRTSSRIRTSMPWLQPCPVEISQACRTRSPYSERRSLNGACDSRSWHKRQPSPFLPTCNRRDEVRSRRRCLYPADLRENPSRLASAMVSTAALTTLRSILRLSICTRRRWTVRWHEGDGGRSCAAHGPSR